jgi:hypothetical protein
MVQVKLKKYGGSLIFQISPDIVEAYGLQQDKTYDLQFSELTITKHEISEDVKELQKKDGKSKRTKK